jgi:beta-phosphoglucomutase
MLDAIIFDFDGVIVDSEPVHFECFRAVLSTHGVVLTSEQYYGKYLGFDDHDCFLEVMRDNGRTVTEEDIAAMTAAKTRLVKRAYQERVKPLPGAAELITAANAAGLELAICSGALREEIELAADAIGIRRHIDVIVAAKDVRRGKPDPEGYLLALKHLGAGIGRPLDTRKVWVVEDSPAGIAAAKAAGCKVLGVTNSYPADALKSADKIVGSLVHIGLADLH